jgi:hypothetical protein
VNHQALSDSVLVAVDITSQIASAGVNGSAIDMQGWDGIEYEFNIGTMASGAAFDARVMSSANSNMSGATNITNAAITQVNNASNANLVIIDIFRPSLRYVQAVTTPATANVTFGVVARRYRRVGTLPPTQATTTLQRVIVTAN